ncbi:SET domain-containing protein [Actinophytocola oryzae]|uniref:SET domain-containing protein n=1 Tax=Actinophytocola oryzae TaxID=502181 RepID=A0A4R7V607_9PSEU|nr:SET domain-containing protein-lysine N-methyltransferase [Actinophytocola oryzae]TDV44192.1 SET domain-containing protein [Actinophytocola oryzae]
MTPDVTAAVRIETHNRKGLMVVAVRALRPGERVVIGRAVQVVPHRTSHSFQIAWDTHVDLDEPARYINHSCDPNTGIQDNNHNGFDFVALRDIAPTEEITWDYETSEYVSIAVAHCLCGAATCRTTIHGFQHRRHDPHWRPTHLANYLRDDTAVNTPNTTPRMTSTSVANGPVTGRCHGAADRQ